MVRHHDNTMGKVASQAAIVHLEKLTLHGVISSDSDGCGRPPLGHGGAQNSEGLLCPRHIAIIKLGIDQLEWRAEQLGGADSASCQNTHTSPELQTHARMPDRNVEAAEKARSVCPSGPCCGGPAGWDPGDVREASRPAPRSIVPRVVVVPMGLHGDVRLTVMAGAMATRQASVPKSFGYWN